jgi:hypothetical protein
MNYLAITTLLLVAASTPIINAATLYVSLTGGHVPPFTNWVNAATNIQDAVDVAMAGDEVMVTNGIYSNGEGRWSLGAGFFRVVVDKPLAVRSINGPQLTTIVGTIDIYGTQCVYLTNRASLSGFTVTNGVTPDIGGGVFCESVTAVVSNCTVVGNSAGSYGGGVWGGTLNNCMLMYNGADWGGGGACDSVLNNCTLTANSAEHGGGAGDSVLSNCTLTANSATSGGAADYSTLNNCTLTGNWVTGESGSGGAAASSTLNNCTLRDNLATGAQGGGGGTYYGTLNNCDLRGNSAAFGGGAYFGALNNCTLTGNSALRSGGGAWSSTLNNCILYYNTGNNYDMDWRFGMTLNYCCTAPLPSSGAGNFTNAPLFVNYEGGDLQLQSNSPCINAGNNANSVGATDLDGNLRIAGGTVDVGACEFQTPSSVLSYAWAQRYGVPTDGSADNADPDQDGMNNLQESRCLTNPTNASSALRMVSSVTAGTNVAVTWQSVAGIPYFLECSTNLGAPDFRLLATNITGLPGTTTYVHTNATDATAAYYRAGVN